MEKVRGFLKYRTGLGLKNARKNCIYAINLTFFNNKIVFDYYVQCIFVIIKIV